MPPNAYDRTEGSLGRPTRDGSSRMDGIGYIPTFGGGVHRSGTHERVASALAISNRRRCGCAPAMNFADLAGHLSGHTMVCSMPGKAHSPKRI